MLDNINFNFDLDGDGILDSFAEEADLDGDGIADSILIDRDGDGIEDAILQDIDLNGDGLADGYQLGLDTDGNGIIDTVTTVFDSNLDGVMDTSQTVYDPNEDGTSDWAETIRAVDTDGDMQPDTMIHVSDDNGNISINVYGAIDVEDINGGDIEDDGDVFDGNWGNEYPELDTDGDSHRGMFIEELTNFDPDSTDPESVIGDPDEAMEEWKFQGDTNRCALYSQKFILDEMTGQDIDIEEIADLAEENGWFSEENGTPLTDMNQILNHFGVENEMTFGNNLEDLIDCLENGGKAIVSIDADEIWYGENDDIFTPGDGPNHAVEVIGIDNSDPENPMVILNDSGNPNGCGEMIPVDVFMDAWEDGDCQMVNIPEV